MPQLIDLLGDGSCAALMLIARDRGITLDVAALERVCPLLETAVTQEYHEIVSQLDALRLLGNEWIREVLNVSCNYAAFVALQQAGLLPPATV